MKKLLFALGLLFPITTVSQTVVTNSDGDEMFNFYTGNSLAIELETGKEEVNFNYNLPVKKSFFYYLNADGTTKDTTIYTSRNIQFAVKIFNTGGNIDYNRIANNRVGFEGKLGFQRTVDKFAKMSRLEDHNQWVCSFGGNVYLKEGNYLMLDAALQENTKKPTSFGINLNLAVYRVVWMASQFSATIGFREWNIDDLPSYYANTPLASNGSFIALDKEARGKYGLLADRDFYQIRFANPFFPFHCAKNVSNRIAFTPYGSVELSDKAKPDYRFGLMFNMLGSGINREANYKIEKGFGIGLDKGSNDENPVLFLRGTFNFGDIKKAKRGNGKLQ